MFFTVIKSIKKVKIHNYLIKQLVLKLNHFLESQKNSIRYLAVINYYLQLLKLISSLKYKHYDDIPLGIPYLQTLKEFHMASDKIERCYNRKLSNAKDLLIKYEPVIDFTVN